MSEERRAIIVHVYSRNYFDPEVMTAVFVQAIGRHTVLTLRQIGGTKPYTCTANRTSDVSASPQRISFLKNSVQFREFNNAKNQTTSKHFKQTNLFTRSTRRFYCCVIIGVTQLHCDSFLFKEDDQKFSVHLTVTIQSSGAQRIFDHPV